MTRGITLFVVVLVGLALVGSLFLATSQVRAQGFEVNIFAPEIITDLEGRAKVENEVGIKFDSVKWYCDWATPFNKELASRLSAGGVSELTWEPLINGVGLPLNAIANGQYDAYIKSFALDIKSGNHLVRINLAPEMNGDWTPWGLSVNGNTKQSFILMWRHVVGIFRENNVTNVAWVWTPNVHYGGELAGDYSTYYPGDNYVDYLGLDGYNWGTSRPTSQWQSFSEVFSPSYLELTQLSKKPILIMEVASTELGGDKSAWIRDMFAVLPLKFSQIVGITWFHMNKETDWRITSSENAKNAFIQSVNTMREPPVTPSSTTPSPIFSSTAVPKPTQSPTFQPTPTGRTKPVPRLKRRWYYRKFYVYYESNLNAQV